MRTPADVFDAARRCVLAWDADGYADLFAADGVLEVPFAPDEWRPRVVRGRDEVRATLRRNMQRGKDAGRRMLAYHDVVLHPCADPDVLVAEFEVEGRTAEAESYRLPYVHVLTVKAGEIASLRDYFSGRTASLATKTASAGPPREDVALFEELRSAILDWDVDAYADLFAADAVIAWPFAPPALGMEPVRGRENIRALTATNMARADAAGRRVVAYHDVRMHPSTEPGVLVVEMIAERRLAGGESSRLPYVWILEVKDGRITALRDYFEAGSTVYAAPRAS